MTEPLLALVAAAQQGNQEAFGHIVKRFQDKVLHLWRFAKRYGMLTPTLC